MKKNANIQYYVEGDDEKSLLKVLKTELQVIKPGKIDVFNVVCDTLSLGRLMTLKPNTVVVLVFDTDAFDDAILKKNIKTLRMCGNVEDIITIPQARNLEEELVKSCNIKDIRELLNSKSKKDFKADLIRTTNLATKLVQKEFDINKLWRGNNYGSFTDLENMSGKIKR